MSVGSQDLGVMSSVSQVIRSILRVTSSNPGVTSLHLQIYA